VISEESEGESDREVVVRRIVWSWGKAWRWDGSFLVVGGQASPRNIFLGSLAEIQVSVSLYKREISLPQIRRGIG